jgi:hypothetical protein
VWIPESTLKKQGGTKKFKEYLTSLKYYYGYKQIIGL